MEVDYVILGGGVAGLTAAIRLTELGIQPLIIEGGHYPSHKVCGEFFSPSCIPLLKSFGISPLLISSTTIESRNEKMSFTFPTPAGSLSHLVLDPLLAKRAVDQGATLWTDTKVDDLKPASSSTSSHQLLLTNGQIIKAKQLIIATGRIPSLNTTRPNFSYMGFKTHFTGLASTDCLEMFTFPGAYLGLSPIEGGKHNIACLASIKKVCKFASPDLFIENLIDQHPELKNRLFQGKNLLGSWLQSSVPEFGYKTTPSWPSTYFIGDAISTIPPACGGGLAFALASSFLAAKFAAKKNPEAYKKAWFRYSARPLFFGKILHRIFLSNHLSYWGLKLSKNQPLIPSILYQLTRDRGIRLSR